VGNAMVGGGGSVSQARDYLPLRYPIIVLRGSVVNVVLPMLDQKGGAANVRNGRGIVMENQVGVPSQTARAVAGQYLTMLIIWLRLIGVIAGNARSATLTTLKLKSHALCVNKRGQIGRCTKRRCS